MAEKSDELHLIHESEISGEIVMILEKTTDHRNGDVFYKVVNLAGHKCIINHSCLGPLLEGELFNRIKKVYKKAERLKKKVRSLKVRNARLLRRK